MLLHEQLEPKNTVNAPIVLVLVGFAAVLFLQAAAIWAHGTLAQQHRQAAENERRFTCYIVRTAQGEAGPSALTSCGFLNLGAK